MMIRRCELPRWRLDFLVGWDDDVEVDTRGKPNREGKTGRCRDTIVAQTRAKDVLNPNERVGDGTDGIIRAGVLGCTDTRCLQSVYAMMRSTSFPGAQPHAWSHRHDVVGGSSIGRPPHRRPYDVLWGLAAASGLASGLAGNDGEAEPSANSAFDPADEDPQLRQMRVEAVLLVAKTPLSTRKLAQLAHLADGTEARTLVRRLNKLYDERGRSVRIEQVAGGFRMLTRAAYAPWLARLGHLPAAIRLSSPMMETLAVVAYRGPVSRADIEAIRGVACGELLRQLMERDLIRISGRSEELGRPYLYDTTKQFLQLFGLSSIDALPPINWDPLRDDEEDVDPEQVDPEHSI